MHRVRSNTGKSPREAAATHAAFSVRDICILLVVVLTNIFICRHKRHKHARIAKESNALLQEPCFYSDRETLDMAYKMIELRQAGAVTSNMTSEVQAVELSAGPQCEACNLLQYFPSGPQDRNIYEISKIRNNPNTMRTFGATRFSGPNGNLEFPPPPIEAGQDFQHEDDKCCFLDLVPPQSKKSPPPKDPGKRSKSVINSTNFGTADALPQGSRQYATKGNTTNAQSDKLPVDLTAPCNTR